MIVGGKAGRKLGKWSRKGYWDTARLWMNPM